MILFSQLLEKEAGCRMEEMCEMAHKGRACPSTFLYPIKQNPYNHTNRFSSLRAPANKSNLLLRQSRLLFYWKGYDKRE
ncbi:hypothetical protein FGG79_18910 [Bacillus sp. BHET2]|uniref:hypothetical protein n=1 Tax=Bacillus sp. BHET2 TaxID=2583818 RepID=UPI00110EC858|nr:hypothetical protein [Bacillus sp. BHET2]TMU83770.1 hypothetical protein FGG79_18910 [Bacillus sp. BHET2]